MSTFSYQELEELICRLHGIPEAGNAISARCKYFHSMSFPDRRPGRGSRAGYEFDDVLKLVMLFELGAVGVTPQRTIAMLRPNWHWVSKVLCLGWCYATNRGAAVDSCLMVVAPRLISDGNDGDLLGTLSRDDAASWSDTLARSGPRGRIVLDPARTTGQLRGLFRGHDIVDQRFIELGTAIFGADVDSWVFVNRLEAAAGQT